MEYKVGDIRNGTVVLPQDKRKKILLLSDDLRLFSGVATMSRTLVMGTAHHFNWVQLGAAIKHKDRGKILDLSDDISKKTGVEDPYVRVIPWEDYGNADILRQIINTEEPDAILHFTDPHFWKWLYQIEHEIRQNIPIMYYTIWDNVGAPENDFMMDPLYNRNFYESCDSLFCISKQTYGMAKRIMSMTDRPTWKPMEDWQISYVPHGINPEVFKPVSVPDKFKRQILGEKDYDFILFWNNVNSRRKQPADLIHAYKRFCDRIGEISDSVCLLMHTNPIHRDGTDLYAVADRINPKGDIKFSTKKIPQEELNYLYNLADCTINIANNEGFGLTTAESVMAGTPIIVNVTGGLQDQCGFTDNGVPITPDDYVELGTLHNKKYEELLEYGNWVSPIWPNHHSIIGSPATPYIWEDRVAIDDIVNAIEILYSLDGKYRKQCGMEGRKSFIKELGLTEADMSKMLVDSINQTLKNWTPKKRYELFKL